MTSGRVMQQGGARRPDMPAASVVVIVACVAFAGAVGGWTGGLRLNLSASMPIGLYRLTSERPSRRAIVLACLPPAIARLARDRDYVQRGSCPGAVEPLGKVVVAIAGDSVSMTADGLTVNGRAVAGSQPLHVDARGRALPQLRQATRIVAGDSVWLYSPYSPRSFDSRYFGPVATANILARVRPFWIVDPRGASMPVDHPP